MTANVTGTAPAPKPPVGRRWKPEARDRPLPGSLTDSSIEHVFDIDQGLYEWPPPPGTIRPEDVIDRLVEDPPDGIAEPVRWSQYVPDGMLADLLTQSADTDPEHPEFEDLERVGGWERVIAWAQARQIREMTSFMASAEARNRSLGACDSPAHDSAVAEVGLMLTVSAGTAACRVGDAWSLCTRLPATLAALEARPDHAGQGPHHQRRDDEPVR